MQINPASHANAVHEHHRPTAKAAAEAAPVASQPAATVSFSKAALAASSAKGDVDHDGDAK